MQPTPSDTPAPDDSTPSDLLTQDHLEEEVAQQRNANVAQNLAGLDALELADHPPRRERAHRLWAATWPKLAAVAIGLFIWQCVVWTGWHDEFILPGPVTVFQAFFDLWTDGTAWYNSTFAQATATTMQRAVIGFAIALIVGVAIGVLCSQVKVIRTSIGSLITGLQTMPSIAWFPLAIVLFKPTEAAIIFVIVIGAAPSIANGVLAGVDNIPPILTRAGRVLGARRWSMYRSVILPGSMPSFVAGLKQGWAFAWRSLMAGELIVTLGRKSIGFELNDARALSDYAGMMATMMLILIIGIAVDSLVFGRLEHVIRHRWGLIDAAAE